MNEHHIAIVEDDRDQRENLADALRRRGMQVSVYEDAKSALDELTKSPPDLLISDIILQGDYDAGLNLCEALLKTHPTLSVIFMTERVEEVDQVVGLRLGAVDYLPKPFSINVLIAKISNHLKRLSLVNESEDEESLKSGDLEIREAYNEVLWKSQSVSLTLTELRMLVRIVKSKGRILTFGQLSDETRQSYVETNTINTHIKNIRKKFRKVDAQFNAIKSEYGAGYRWDP